MEQLLHFSLEGWVDFGDDETRKVMLASGLANHQFDIFLENFRYSEARVRVIERSVITDTTWSVKRISVFMSKLSGFWNKKYGR